MKEMWEQRYASAEYVYGKEPNCFFRENIDTLIPGKILLPGEGEGRNAVYAAKRRWKVYAFDQSHEARKKASRLASENSVRLDYSVCDLTGYNFRMNYFDAVAIVYFHLPESARAYFFDNVRDCLKKGGWIVAEVFSKIIYPGVICGPSLVEMRYEKQELENYFKVFKIIQCSQTDIALDEGDFHKGKVNVIRLTAMKL